MKKHKQASFTALGKRPRSVAGKSSKWNNGDLEQRRSFYATLMRKPRASEVQLDIMSEEVKRWRCTREVCLSYHQVSDEARRLANVRKLAF